MRVATFCRLICICTYGHVHSERRCGHQVSGKSPLEEPHVGTTVPSHSNSPPPFLCQKCSVAISEARLGFQMAPLCFASQTTFDCRARFAKRFFVFCFLFSKLLLGQSRAYFFAPAPHVLVVGRACLCGYFARHARYNKLLSWRW